MSAQKKGFAAFVRPAPVPKREGTPDAGSRAGAQAPERPNADIRAGSSLSGRGDGGSHEGERIRTVTATGRVRTFSASRQLPGITLRVTEERWERLKMMSIQERRPLQEIVSEAMELYMRERGLPW